MHHPDSPYGLIQNVLKQTKPSVTSELSLIDLGGLETKDVWLSQGDLLVLKGTPTPKRFNNYAYTNLNLCLTEVFPCNLTIKEFHLKAELPT